MLLYYLFVLAAVFLPVWFLVRHFQNKRTEERAIHELSDTLFRLSGLDESATIEDLNRLTGGRFTPVQLKDYFLKIKGLQIIDLHTTPSHAVRTYLLKPTKIRLKHHELIYFYEKYLNYQQPTGESAV